MDKERSQAGKIPSGSVKPFCDALPKGRVGSVSAGARCHFGVVFQ